MVVGCHAGGEIGNVIVDGVLATRPRRAGDAT
jgi:hypothetical protein